MLLHHTEATRILRLIAFADNESMAGNEDLRLGLRIMSAFPYLDWGSYKADFEKTLAYVPPPPPPPNPETQLDLSLAYVLPGIWPEATGIKDASRWW